MHPDSLLRPLASLIVLAVALGYYITGSPLWGLQTRWTNPNYLMFRYTGPRNFTESELAHFTGQHGTPIYLAVDGMVFDVSSRPDTYGPLGSYHFFTGRDAARAFATGCFREDLTHDLRGLPPQMLDAVKGWQNFFLNNLNYWHIGYVHHDEPTGPIPPLCEAARRTAERVH